MGYSYLTGRDLGLIEDVEQIRRSVAMLPPRADALTREDALVVLDTLLNLLRSGGRD